MRTIISVYIREEKRGEMKLESRENYSFRTRVREGFQRFSRTNNKRRALNTENDRQQTIREAWQNFRAFAFSSSFLFDGQKVTFRVFLPLRTGPRLTQGLPNKIISHRECQNVYTLLDEWIHANILRYVSLWLFTLKLVKNSCLIYFFLLIRVIY